MTKCLHFLLYNFFTNFQLVQELRSSDDSVGIYEERALT